MIAKISEKLWYAGGLASFALLIWFGIDSLLLDYQGGGHQHWTWVPILICLGIAIAGKVVSLVFRGRS